MIRRPAGYGYYWALPIVTLCLSGGCGRGPRPHPVEGELFVGGKPAGGALVYFHSVASDTTTDSFVPKGEVSSDGTFQLTTFRPGDGAPIGIYRVTMTWSREGGERLDEEQHPDEVSRAFDRVPASHRDPKTTPITVQIAAGLNSFKFEVEENADHELVPRTRKKK